MSLQGRLPELRRARGMRQEDLAMLLGVTRTAVVKWERGVYEPGYTRLSQIAEIFNTTTDYLLGRTDQRYPSQTAEVMDAYLTPTGDRALDYAKQALLLSFHRTILEIGCDLTQDDLDTLLDLAKKLVAKNKKTY